jgi:hypothetical protein
MASASRRIGPVLAHPRDLVGGEVALLLHRLDVLEEAAAPRVGVEEALERLRGGAAVAEAGAHGIDVVAYEGWIEHSGGSRRKAARV